MKMQFIRFMLSPGDEDIIIPSSNEPTPVKLPKAEDVPSTDEPAEEPFLDRVKDALQDWSNKDQADSDFDDTRV